MSRWRSLLCWSWGLLLVCSAIAGPAPAAAPPRYVYQANHDPNGIGKFYLGREIARVMGHDAADWLERPERDAEEHTGELMTLLQLKPGEVVADIGAGTGYFTRRLARAVGGRGKVFAVDVQPDMLRLLTNRLAAVGLTNVVPVLGSETDPGLPADSLDLALLVDVYHELAFPWEMMQAVCRALKPGGRLVLVEFRAEDPEVPIKAVHKMTEAQVRRELALHPVTWVQTGRLPRQHVICFQKRGQVSPERNPSAAE
ncbi:MAG TPA: methyltransferase domain-containing protein [Clostridia bacterium]|nr:methyltransferase domain-containing protein [Clostridia bacterium]